MNGEIDLSGLEGLEGNRWCDACDGVQTRRESVVLCPQNGRRHGRVVPRGPCSLHLRGARLSYFINVTYIQLYLGVVPRDCTSGLFLGVAPRSCTSTCTSGSMKDCVCACRTCLWYVTTVAALGAALGVWSPSWLGGGRGATCDASTLSVAAPFYIAMEVPVPWTGVVGYGTVCQGSCPTTLTPRTVYSFFNMYSFVITTRHTAHGNTNGSVGTGDVVHAWSVCENCVWVFSPNLKV